MDRIKYGYDRNGSRLYRENTVAAANGKSFDELYAHDLIDRLKTMDRGDLNDLKSQIQNLQFAQDWSLDATGNWRNFRGDDDGDTTWDLNQQRTSNKVNEISDIAESVGPSWGTPVYNRAGNMTTIPKPADPTGSFSAAYDAWNRLVKIEEGSDKVAEYEYDGARRRSVKKTYSSGVLDETRHLFYTELARWQLVEERVDTATDPDRQFVWGRRYVDDIILRDRDTTGDGTLDERLYAVQDANWNVTALSNVGGTISERFSYSSYGLASYLTPSFEARSSTSFGWDVLFAGYRWDSSTALYDVRNRAYDAKCGCWLQRDSAGLHASPNLYEYCRAMPLSLIDPLGLAPFGLFGPPDLGEVKKWLTTLWSMFCDLLQDPCYGNLLYCVCGFLDIIELPLQLVDDDTGTLLAVIGDCFCAVQDILATLCNFGNCPNQAFWTILLESGDCLLNFVDGSLSWQVMLEFLKTG